MTLAERMTDNADRIAHPCPTCEAGRGRQCIAADGRTHAARLRGLSPELDAFIRATVR